MRIPWIPLSNPTIPFILQDIVSSKSSAILFLFENSIWAMREVVIIINNPNTPKRPIHR